MVKLKPHHWSYQTAASALFILPVPANDAFGNDARPNKNWGTAHLSRDRGQIAPLGAPNEAAHALNRHF
ncbi:hypothetical protein [Bradyrhizobium sacchari]|uniref:hypothetical protein n=1 Tax=Bradyrhizobium sacchari TaxID=1399419 RepID=UPI00142E9CE9|nr:hypothetical protein [Bradyrhizobium sacchari]